MKQALEGLTGLMVFHNLKKNMGAKSEKNPSEKATTLQKTSIW